MKNKIKSLWSRLFTRKQPTLGPQVFECRPWLQQKVQDAMWEAHRNYFFDLD